MRPLLSVKVSPELLAVCEEADRWMRVNRRPFGKWLGQVLAEVRRLAETQPVELSPACQRLGCKPGAHVRLDAQGEG